MADGNDFVYIAGNKIAVTEKIPIIVTTEMQFDSFIKGHHLYQSIWQPKIGEKLKAMIELNNVLLA